MLLQETFASSSTAGELVVQWPEVGVGEDRVRQIHGRINDAKTTHRDPHSAWIRLREVIRWNESQPELEDHAARRHPQHGAREIHETLRHGLVDGGAVDKCGNQCGKVVDQESNENATGQGFGVVILVVRGSHEVPLVPVAV